MKEGPRGRPGLVLAKICFRGLVHLTLTSWSQGLAATQPRSHHQSQPRSPVHLFFDWHACDCSSSHGLPLSLFECPAVVMPFVRQDALIDEPSSQVRTPAAGDVRFFNRTHDLMPHAALASWACFMVLFVPFAYLFWTRRNTEPLRSRSAQLVFFQLVYFTLYVFFSLCVRSVSSPDSLCVSQ